MIILNLQRKPQTTAMKEPHNYICLCVNSQLGNFEVGELSFLEIVFVEIFYKNSKFWEIIGKIQKSKIV